MKSLLVLVGISLACSISFSQETCEDASSYRTVEKFVEAQKLYSENFLAASASEFGCAPHGKVVMVVGQPICHLNFLGNLIPVNAVFAGSVDQSDAIADIGYLMRGTKQDVDSAMAYFDKKYARIPTEELKAKRWETYFGFSHAWKNGTKYIVLGQHEPGYDPIEMSLHLSIGTEKGLEVSGADLNSCK